MNGSVTTATVLLTWNTRFRQPTVSSSLLPALDRDDNDDEELTYASPYLSNVVTRHLWMLVPPVLIVLGFVGNVMTIVVMRGLWRASPDSAAACLCVYFTALAVSDLFVICTSFVWFWPELVLNTPVAYFHHLSCSVPLFVYFTGSLTSAWFLVAMTCQRLTSVMLPHRVGVLCTVSRGKVITAVIVAFSCAANAHFFFHYRVEVVEAGYENCVSVDKDIVNVFRVLDLCLASMIPFFLLITANCVLIYAIVQSIHAARALTVGDAQHTKGRSSKVSSMTVTLVLISTLFLLLTMPACIFGLYLEMVGYFDGRLQDEHQIEMLALGDTVCKLLWMSNSAINFYIYILSGRKFREETKRIVCQCFKRH